MRTVIAVFVILYIQSALTQNTAYPYATTYTPKTGHETPTIRRLGYGSSYGQRVFFSCETPSNSSDYTFTFWKGDDKLQESYGSNAYVITYLTETHTGSYWCSIKRYSYSENLKSNNSVYLYVARQTTTIRPSTGTETPTIRRRGSSYDSSYGQMVSFACDTPSNSSDYTFTFWRGDDKLQERYIHNAFDIPYLKEIHTGTYWCSIKRSPYEQMVKSNNSVYLNVGARYTTTTKSYESPRFEVEDMPYSGAFAPGAGTKLICHSPFAGDYSYEFTKDGYVIASTRSNVHYLYNMQYEDQGYYTCAVLMVYRKSEAYNTVYIRIEDPQPIWTDRPGVYPSSSPRLMSLTSLLLLPILVTFTFPAA